MSARDWMSSWVAKAESKVMTSTGSRMVSKLGWR